MRTPTIAAALLAGAAAVLGACATNAGVDSNNPQLVRATADPGVPTNAAALEFAQPPKGCRGGAEDGRAVRWVLEFRQGGSALQAKGWTHTWQEWADDVEMRPRGQRPLTSRVRVTDNWTIYLEFRRDGQVITAERLSFQEPCVYAYQDRENNIYLFYKKG